MMMFRTVFLAALVAPLAFGEYSYTYEYTDAPTAAPTAETMSPTTSGAPTRSETYAPTRMVFTDAEARTRCPLVARNTTCARPTIYGA